MSELRDHNFIVELAKGLSIDAPIDKDIAQEICSQVEIELRSLIEDSIKFMRHFKRDKLNCSDVEHALKDRNYYDKIFGYDVCEKVQFKRHSNFWIKQDEERDLQQYLEAQVKSLKRQVHQPQIHCWWMSIDGKIPQFNENTRIKNKAAIMKFDELKKEEQSKNFNVIKDKPRSLLTDDINKFFVEITKIIAESEQEIDDPLIQPSGSTFQETPKLKIILANLRTNSGLTSMLPFLLNYLYQDYDLEQINGVSKKFITLRILNALILNTGLNIEFHLHIFIKILIHFISASKLSANICLDESKLREESSECMAYLVNRFTFKYISLKQNICETLLGIIKGIMEQNVLNYQVLLGITMTFNHFESNIIRQLLLPIILQLLSTEQFRKDLNCLNSGNMKNSLRQSRSSSSHQIQGQNFIVKRSDSSDRVKNSAEISKNNLIVIIQRNNEAHQLLNQLQLLILKVFNEYSYATSKTEVQLFQELEEQFITELNPLVVRLVYNNLPIQQKYLSEKSYNPSYMNIML